MTCFRGLFHYILFESSHYVSCLISMKKPTYLINFQISAKKKRGKCVCISGYERSNATGLCENENSNSLAKVKSAPTKKELTIDILGPSSVQLPLDSVLLVASPTGESAKG